MMSCDYTPNKSYTLAVVMAEVVMMVVAMAAEAVVEVVEYRHGQ